MSVYLAAVLIYLIGLTAVAVWRTSAVKTGDDFLLASRTLPATVLALTLLATWISAGSLFAGAGLGYRSGFPALWQAAGAWAGIAIVYLLAPRARAFGQYTVSDLLGVRYGPSARVLATLAIAIAYTTIAGFQFRGGGRLLSLISNLDPTTGALAVAGVCVACTALAGMRSVSLLDVGNGLLMLVGLALAVVFLAGRAGGVTPALSALRPDQLSLFGAISPRAAVALALPTMVLLLGEASMYQKVFSSANVRSARLAVLGWLAATVVVEILLFSVGIFGSLAVPALPPPESDTIVVRVALDVLPTLLGVFLLVAGMAIIISTANSFLLTPATALTRDVYQRLVNPAASDAQIVLFTRVFIIVLGLAGAIAGSVFPTLLSMALWAYTMYGAGVTPALVAALVWPRATRTAGVASIAAGMGVTLLWEVLAVARGTVSDPAPLLGVQTIYPALALSIGTLVTVSLVTPQERG